MNLVVLSAGRRVSLLRGFQSAAGRLGGRVFGADLSPEMSAACHIADDSFALPHVLSDEYAQALLAACLAHEVGVVVPTIDTELAVLAQLRDRFLRSGIELVVSDSEFVQVCRDKRSTIDWFESRALPVPRPMELNALEYPAFGRPYDGSLSKDIVVLKCEADVVDAVRNNPKLIFAEYLDPVEHSEFTCDLYFDRQHKLRCVVPRERLVVRGGEVAKARTAKNEIVDELFDKLATVPGARGCITVQLFRHNQNGTLAFIEVNARFGGGYPLSRHAGADFQRWLVDEYIEDKPVETYNGWRDRMIMLRFDDEVIVASDLPSPQ